MLDKHYEFNQGTLQVEGTEEHLLLRAYDLYYDDCKIS